MIILFVVMASCFIFTGQAKICWVSSVSTSSVDCWYGPDITSISGLLFAIIYNTITCL